MAAGSPEALGLWTAISSAAAATIVAFLLRTRLPSPAVTLFLVVAGAAVAWGALRLTPGEPSGAEWVLAVAAMAVLLPLHVRIVLGPFGPRR